MIRFAVRSFFSRKLRAFLTALAIVLGVAMICGTYVLTDSMQNAFGAIFTTVYKNTDAVVQGKSAISSNSDSAPPFPQSYLAKVRALPDVNAAIGGVASQTAHLIGKNGKTIAFGGAPNLGFSVDPSLPELNSLDLVSGTWPGPNEVVIDKHVASSKGLEVGEPIGVQAAGPVERLRISGIVTLGGSASIGGATLAGFDLETAQRLFAKEGQLDQIRVDGKPNVSSEKLVSEIRDIPGLTRIATVRTGQGQAEEDTSQTNDGLSFLQDFLLAFGGIALFVGAFVIANSLSITIAQRTRELATLRTLGASRRQVLRSVLFEALMLGVIASAIGLGLGVALAQGLAALFDALGITLPRAGLPLETRTILVSLLVGIFVTLVASLRPALRSTRVPPIAAAREGAVLPEGRFARYRGIGAAVTTLLGFAALAYGLFGSGLSTTAILSWMGLGVLLVFIGVALLSARFVRPLAWALGWPAAKIGGSAGQLARENARRNPQRTASTAAALMIGLTLVTVVAMLASAIRTSFEGSVKDIFIADYAVEAQNNYDPLPVSVERTVKRAVPRATVTGVRAGRARILGSNRDLTAVQPTSSKQLELDWKEGSQATLDTLGRDGAFISNAFAKDHHLSVGSTIQIVTPQNETPTFTIKGIFDPPAGGSPFGSLTISSARFDELYSQPENLYTFVSVPGGATSASTARLDRALQPFPNAKVADRDQFVTDQLSGIDNILNILYLLLALSVVISLFGIVNVLVLSVFERTREIGMVRAIGMTRRQVRRMIRHESVVTALIGAVIGILLGIVLATLLIVRVDFLVFSLPIVSLIVFAVAAVLVGIIAAIFPARRAARLNVLQALQYE